MIFFILPLHIIIKVYLKVFKQAYLLLLDLIVTMDFYKLLLFMLNEVWYGKVVGWIVIET